MICFLSKASRVALGPTQPPNQSTLGAFPLGVVQTNSFPCSAEVKSVCGAILRFLAPNTAKAWCWTEHRDNSAELITSRGEREYINVGHEIEYLSVCGLPQFIQASYKAVHQIRP